MLYEDYIAEKDFHDAMCKGLVKVRMTPLRYSVVTLLLSKLGQLR